MTETTAPKAEKSIAERVRHSRGPTGDMAELSRQASRLRRALDVANEWENTAARASTEMFAEAGFTRDSLEEELSRVSWEIESLHNLLEYRRARRNAGMEADEEEAKSGHLSDTLLDIYCTLSSAPLEAFGVAERVAEERTRYSMMGALLAAMDALSAED